MQLGVRLRARWSRHPSQERIWIRRLVGDFEYRTISCQTCPCQFYEHRQVIKQGTTMRLTVRCQTSDIDRPTSDARLRTPDFGRPTSDARGRTPAVGRPRSDFRPGTHKKVTVTTHLSFVQSALRCLADLASSAYPPLRVDPVALQPVTFPG